MESFFITPDQDFRENTEFFSELKLSAVNDEDYDQSKYLYQTLKMRNLGDLNDLNAQDVILLTEMIVLGVVVLKEKCLKSFLHFQQNINMSKFLNKLFFGGFKRWIY